MGAKIGFMSKKSDFLERLKKWSTGLSMMGVNEESSIEEIQEVIESISESLTNEITDQQYRFEEEMKQLFNK